MSEKRKTISKKALFISFLDWLNFSHSCYNYARLQAISFGEAMYWVLKDLYPTKEEIGREMEKHMIFFNTEPNVGAIIHGIVCAMEEERANFPVEDNPITPESITAVKTGLMGPFAGIGDTITQGIMTPLLLSISIGMAMDGNMLAPWFFFLSSALIIWAIGWGMWSYGYQWGKEAVNRILEGGLMNTILLSASILGCTVMGALVATNVKVFTPIKMLIVKATATNPAGYMLLQNGLFDAILKGLLPIGVTFLTLHLLKKGWSANKIMGVLSVAAFVLGALGILSNVAPKL